MMISLQLAFRNVFANRQRSLAIYTAISLVSTVLFLFLSFSDGEIENFTKGIEGLRTPPADLVITHWDYLRAREAGEKAESLNAMTVANFRPLGKGIAAVDGVARVYARTIPVTAGLHVDGKTYEEIQFLGVDMDNDNHVRDRIRILEGSWLSGNPDGLLLHLTMKEDYGVEVGDRVTVTGKTLFGQALAETFVVEGFYRAQVDLSTIFRPIYTGLPGYDLVSGFYASEVSFLQVDLLSGADRDKTIQALEAMFEETGAEVAVHVFGSIHPQSVEIYGTIRSIIVFITLLVVFVVMFGVMNVVSTNLVDRSREIGTYYCLGASRGFLKRMYTLEILLVNLAGAVTGILIGLGVALALNGAGFKTDDVGLQMVLGGDRLHLGISVSSIALLLGGLIAVTALTALFTLGSALRVSPAAAMRDTRD